MTAKQSGPSGSSDRSPSTAESVPVAMRVGGSFLALAVVLFIFTVVSWISDGWGVPFAVTINFLMICVAAVIFGAFATVKRNQRASVSQVVALAIAVILIFASTVLPTMVLGYMGQYWLLMYALLAVLCALIIRRSLMPK